MNTSNATLSYLALAVALSLVYVVDMPLREPYRSSGIADTKSYNAYFKTPYMLAAMAAYWAITLFSVLGYLAIYFNTLAYWEAVAACLGLAPACYFLFREGIAGRLASIFIMVGAFIVSVILYNNSNQELRGGGTIITLLPFLIFSIFLLRHRREYAELWKSSKFRSVLPRLAAVVVVFYAAELALFLTR